jgi:hypothetical protein
MTNIFNGVSSEKVALEVVERYRGGGVVLGLVRGKHEYIAG